MAKLFANREDPDQTPHILRRLIWVCTVANYPFRGLQTTMDQTHTRKPSAFSEKGGLPEKGWFMGWGLTICLWLGLPWFNYWFSFTLACSRISHEYSSLFIIVINLIFMFSL